MCCLFVSNVSSISLSNYCCFFFFFKQKTAYEMRISDWSSDVCSSDLDAVEGLGDHRRSREREQLVFGADEDPRGITLARAVEQSGDLLLALEIVEQVAHTLQIGGGGKIGRAHV